MNQKFIALVAIVSAVVAGFIVVLGWRGYVAALLYGAFSIGALMVTRSAWAPENYGKTRVWIAVVAGIVGIGSCFLIGGHWINPVLVELGFSTRPTAIEHVARLVVATTCIVALIAVARAWERGTARLRKKEEGSDPDLVMFKRALSAVILQMDLDVEDRAFFEPLFVEVDSGSKRRKYVVRLLDALSRLRSSELALLLGIPGAGKSVTLREFVVRELNRSGSHRIPLYVSLEGWRGEPTAEQLVTYVIERVKQMAPHPVIRGFLDRHFDRLLQSDGWLFVLDGFDEIPALLDATEPDILRKYSSAVAQFAAASMCPTVVASRTYRHPQLATRHTRCTLVPLSERQMNHVLVRIPGIAPELRRAFMERGDLVQIARTPFFLRLVREHLERSRTLPSTRADLFRSYIESRRDAVATSQCPVVALDEACVAIARLMFHSGSEFEVDTDEIRKLVPDATDILMLLRRARLVRYHDEGKRIAFVHRRFAEYFAASRIDSLSGLDVAEIAKDTRWREVIALRCEMADEAEARAFAEKLFVDADGAGLFDLAAFPQEDAEHRRATDVLRFIRDAFATRPSLLHAHRERIGSLAAELSEETDVLRARAIVELVPFMADDARERVLAWALACAAPIIQETAFRLSRYCEPLQRGLRGALLKILLDVGTFEFFERQRDWRFVLGLSTQTQAVARFVWVRWVSIACLAGGISCCVWGAIEADLTADVTAVLLVIAACLGLMVMSRTAMEHVMLGIAIVLGSMVMSISGLEIVGGLAVIAFCLGALSLAEHLVYRIFITKVNGGAVMRLLCLLVIAFVLFAMVVLQYFSNGGINPLLVQIPLGALVFVAALFPIIIIHQWWAERRRVDALPLPTTTVELEEVLGSLSTQGLQLRYLDRVFYSGTSLVGAWSDWHSRFGMSRVSSRLLEIADRNGGIDGV